MSTAITAFLKYVRLETPGCPEPLLVDAVMRACIDFCTRTELLTEIISLDTVAGTSLYAVTPTDTTLYPARLRNVLKDDLPLEKTTAELYALLTDRTDSASPTSYFAPARNLITFAPVPDAVETLVLDVALRPARDATAVPDVLYEEWVDTIAAGAKSTLMLMLGQPWANPELGTYYLGRFDSGIATAAATVAQGNTGAAMRITPLEI